MKVLVPKRKKTIKENEENQASAIDPDVAQALQLIKGRIDQLLKGEPAIWQGKQVRIDQHDFVSKHVAERNKDKKRGKEVRKPSLESPSFNIDTSIAEIISYAIEP
jgi:hypothetical protein